MYKKSITHYITKIIIEALFYLSIVCVIISPVFSKWLFGGVSYRESMMLVGFEAVIFSSGLCCTYILYNLKQMFKSLLVGNPFVDKNVCHLRKIAVACFIIAIIYVSKCFFLFTYATAIIIAIFVVGSLFCLTLKDLFKQAINYKTENELTI